MKTNENTNENEKNLTNENSIPAKSSGDKNKIKK